MHPSFQAIAEDATGNFVYSPISLTGLLSMASWGAAGNTKSQLLSAIEHPYESAPSREPESSEESSEVGLDKDRNNLFARGVELE